MSLTETNQTEPQQEEPKKTAHFPPTPPVPDRDVRWELAAALRHFGRLGYEFGFNGHVTARAPEVPGHYWVNPFGVSISTVRPEDFVLVNGQGETVEPRTAHGTYGFAGNLALHEALPEVNVVFHLHTPRGFIWSNLGRPLEAVNTDSAGIIGLQGLSRQIWGGGEPTSNLDLARQGKRVFIQDGHGFVTWGGGVGEAAFYLWAAERAADANLALLGVEGAQRLPEQLVQGWTLTPELARAHFEPAFTFAERSGL